MTGPTHLQKAKRPPAPIADANRVPMHRQIARKVRNDIEAGVLTDREVLPSTRDLAHQWGVSVFTISEAMRLLADDGLIVTKARSGRIVNRPESALSGPVRSTTPHLLLIGGYAGSGKTEFGRTLARATSWPILDKDTTTRPVVERALEVLGQPAHDRESDIYNNVIRPREYEALMATAAENVACGVSVITTAPFLREFTDSAWIDRTRAQFETYGAKVTLVWMRSDHETMHAYLRHRGAARDATKLATWPTYLRQVDTTFEPPAPHIVVENSASSEPLQSQAKRLLSTVLAEERP